MMMMLDRQWQGSYTASYWLRTEDPEHALYLGRRASSPRSVVLLLRMTSLVALKQELTACRTEADEADARLRVSVGSASAENSEGKALLSLGRAHTRVCVYICVRACACVRLCAGVCTFVPGR